MSDNFISDSKAWFSSDDTQKKAAIATSFNNLYGNDKAYLNATPAVQAEYQKAHQQVIEAAAYNHTDNPFEKAGVVAQESADRKGVLANWGTQIKDSHINLGNRLNLFKEIIAGNETAAKTASLYYEKEKSQIETKETKALAASLKTGFDSWGKGNYLTAAGQIAGAAVSNFTGVMDVAAKSMSSMTSMGLGALVGAKTGGLLGSVAGPEGTAVGALWGGRTGAVAAETVDAASGKFAEILRDRLTSQNLVPTESNIAQVLSDKEWLNSAKQKALVYGSSLSIADQLTAGLTTKIAELPMQTAKRAARLALTEANHAGIAVTAQATGKTIAAETDHFVSQIAASTLAARSFKAKIGGHIAGYVGEVASEPISEAIGTASVGDENTIENLTYETLGGIGTGPFGAAINKATWGTKLVTDKAVNAGKRVIQSTPETRAAAVAQGDIIKQATNENEAGAELKYKEKVAAIEPNSDEHNALADHTNPETYNPIKAMDITIKIADPESHDKALDIANNYDDLVLGKMQEFKALQAKMKQEGYKPTVAEVDELDNLHQEIKIRSKTSEQLWNKVDVLKAQLNDKVNPTPINFETDSPEDMIVKLGSHGSSKKKGSSSVEDIDVALNRPEVQMDSGITEALTTLKETKVLRDKVESTKPTEQNVDTRTKDISSVSKDIYEGARGSFFKGIDAYQRGIQYFLGSKSDTDTTPRSVEKAQKELDGLRKFSDLHNEKAEMVTAAYEALSAKTPKPVPANVQQYLTDNNITIHPITSKNYVPAIQQEAAAFKAEVKLAELTFNRLSGQTNTTTSTQAQTAPTEAISKPTVTPVALNTPVTPIPISGNTVPVITTPPATTTVVESKPASDITQPITPAERYKKLDALKTEYNDGKGVTTDTGLQELQTIIDQAKANPKSATSAIAKLEEFKTKYETTHKAQKSASVSAPETASNTESIVAPTPTDKTAPKERKERKPRKRVPPMRNLFTDIRKLGGVTREALMYAIDENVIMGRSRKGKRINLYRRITNKESTFSLDQLAEAMRSEGWHIPVDDYGKAELQPFLDMIQNHKNGDRPIHPDDVERVQRIRERKELLRMKQEGFEAFESKEVIQEQMDQWDDEANTETESGHAIEEIEGILEELTQEDAARKTQGVSTNDGGQSSTDVGETRGESTDTEYEALVSLGIDPDMADYIIRTPDISDSELRGIAKELINRSDMTGHTEADIQESINGFVQSIRDILNPNTEEKSVDKLAEYDINYANDLQINFGTEAEPKMMTYAEAIKEHKQRVEDAENLRLCVNS